MDKSYYYHEIKLNKVALQVLVKVIFFMDDIFYFLSVRNKDSGGRYYLTRYMNHLLKKEDVVVKLYEVF